MKRLQLENLDWQVWALCPVRPLEAQHGALVTGACCTSPTGRCLAPLSSRQALPGYKSRVCDIRRECDKA